MAAAQARTARGRIAIYLLAIAFAVFSGFPFLWAALTMFRQNSDLYDPTHNPFVLTRPATLGHVTDLLRNTPYLQFIGNNIVIGLATVVITLALSLPAACSSAATCSTGSRSWRRRSSSRYPWPCSTTSSSAASSRASPWARSRDKRSEPR